MPVISAEMRPRALPGGRYFRPTGKVHFEGAIMSPPWKTVEDKVYSATIVMGMSRAGGKKITKRSVMQFVRRMREDQVGDPSASFVWQSGIYRHRQSGHVVEEEGVQIVIMSLFEESRDTFQRQHILPMAEAMARHFGQEIIYVTFALGGLTEELVEVTP